MSLGHSLIPSMQPYNTYSVKSSLSSDLCYFQYKDYRQKKSTVTVIMGHGYTNEIPKILNISDGSLLKLRTLLNMHVTL